MLVGVKADAFSQLKKIEHAAFSLSLRGTTIDGLSEINLRTTTSAAIRAARFLAGSD